MQPQELATIFCGQHFNAHHHTLRKAVDSIGNSYRQARIYFLTFRRKLLTIFNAKVNHSAFRIAESNTIFGQLIKISLFPLDRLNRFPVIYGVFFHRSNLELQLQNYRFFSLGQYLSQIFTRKLLNRIKLSQPPITPSYFAFNRFFHIVRQIAEQSQSKQSL